MNINNLFIPEEFLNNKFTKNGNFYIPKNPGDNIFRHFGIKKEKKLFLSKLEVFYIFHKTLDNYKFLKNNNKYKNNLIDQNNITEKLNMNIYNINYEEDIKIPKFVIPYFYLKDHDFNILQQNNELFLYKKTKNFNRNIDKPIGTLIVKNSNDLANNIIFKKNLIVCVVGNNDFSILSVSKVEGLDFNTPKILNKY